MVRNREGIHYGIGSLDIIPQEGIKTVFIYAFFRNGTTETAKTPTGKGILSYIHDPALIGKLHPEALCHPAQV